MSDPSAPEQTLPLDAWHRANGARMVPFAGYAMPIQYEGIIAEHNGRDLGGLFDVSHMGQLLVGGPRCGKGARYPASPDLRAQGGGLRYSRLLAVDGGILAT